MSNGVVRFGVFEVDPDERELRRSGLRVRLQEQPLQVLLALLEHPGEVVNREDLVRRLWADGTFVDYERGLNAAVNRLRQALSDCADVPRYVETIPRRGYRFIGQIDTAGGSGHPDPVSMPIPRLRPWRAVLLALFGIAGAAWLFVGMWVRHTDAKLSELKVSPLTTGLGVERNPTFSPDGSQVAYEWQREDGTRRIYIKVVGSGDPTLLTIGAGADYGPAWSPDGKLIAFLRQSNKSTLDVMVVPPVGGVERKVAETAAPQYWTLQQFHRRLDWTADNRHLVVSAPERYSEPEGLLLIGVHDGEKRWLSIPSPGHSTGDREPAVSPDGRLIAFARGNPGAAVAVYILPLTPDLKPAGAARPLPSVARGRSPAWMPDAKRIVFTQIEPIVFESGVSLVEVDGGAPRPLLALGRNAAVPAVARTGRLAYSRIVMQGNIWRQEIPAQPGAAPPPVKVTDSSAWDCNAQYSPDGSRIAFASNRSGAREIWTCASDGQRCVQITSFNGSFMSGTPRWSPDGKFLVFDSAATGQLDVYVVSADGGPPRRLTADAIHGRVPSWSHDGRWIYFSCNVTGRNEIWKVPSGGSGKAVQVTQNGGYVVFDSPDGRYLYYTKTEQNSELFRRPLAGGAETEVLSGVAMRGFAVAADRIYYLKQARDGLIDLRRFMLASHEDSLTAPLGKDVFLGLDISPDSKSVIYSQIRVASNLMSVEPFR